jgi:hypothetical protein
VVATFCFVSELVLLFVPNLVCFYGALVALLGKQAVLAATPVRLVALMFSEVAAAWLVLGERLAAAARAWFSALRQWLEG